MSLAAVPDGIPPALDQAEFTCPHCGDVAAMTRTAAPPLPKPTSGEWMGFGFTTCAACGATAAWATQLGYTDEGVGIIDPSSAVLVYPR